MRRVTIALVAALSLAGCAGDDDGTTTAASPLPQGGAHVQLDPADFSATIDNRWWPMAPGSRWVYREHEGGSSQRVEVTVTDKTKRVAAGVTARVVHDVVSENGEVKEDTFDWYAQDSAGNVWYMGEDTKEYENGKVSSTEGSWEAGVDGAQAGVIMPAHPKPGMAYRQEYYKGHAEDAALVLSVDERAKVPFGRFNGLVMTKDYTPLEPNAAEYKFYAAGVGPVLTTSATGGSSREELISFKQP
jgi:hypothetical protein